MTEMSTETKAMAQIYSVLCAVVQSEHTPNHTTEAIIQTLQKIFEAEDGPFQENAHMMGMTMAMVNNMNELVKQRNSRVRQKEGASILDNISWN